MLAFIESLIENSSEIDVARENTAKTTKFLCYIVFFSDVEELHSW